MRGVAIMGAGKQRMNVQRLFVVLGIALLVLLVGTLSAGRARVVVPCGVWVPPNGAFAAVWGVLYVLLGAGLGIAVTDKNVTLTRALWLSVLASLQIGTIILWVRVYAKGQYGVALAATLVLSVLSLVSIIVRPPLEGILQAPKLIWSLFAAMLLLNVLQQIRGNRPPYACGPGEEPGSEPGVGTAVPGDALAA